MEKLHNTLQETEVIEDQVKKRKEKNNIFVKQIDSSGINLLSKPMKQLQHKRMISWQENKYSQETH